MSLLGLLSACGGPNFADPVDMHDPGSCAGCHPTHHDQWSGSMHAYASEDPVFRAMNKKGQEQTNGELGDFCVKCHAPMAVELGLTTDGLNLDEVPEAYQGVGCYYCHTVTAVEGTHNNPLKISDDGILRGGLRNPVDNVFHASEYSPLLDRTQAESGALCGSCHDIVNEHGVHLERTYTEWLASNFGHPESEVLLTCGNCHMNGSDQPAAMDGPERRYHDHQFFGVDVALTPFPNREEQLAGVQKELDGSLYPDLCVRSTGDSHQIQVFLENIAAGHNFPSGATADRRVWIELVAYADGAEIYSTGIVPDGVALYEIDDPDRVEINDTWYDATGEITHNFWDARIIQGDLLPTQNYGDIPNSNTKVYPFRPGARPDRVEMRVRMRPMGLEILDELVDEGYLDPAIPPEMPTFDLGSTTLVWSEDLGDCVYQ